MPLPYEQLTQILGIEASDYPPEHETTPEFMNKKFNELLVNDKELLKQINDLNGKVTKYGQGTEKTIEGFASWDSIGSGFARVNSNQQGSPSVYHQAVIASYFDANHGLYLSMDTGGKLYASKNKSSWNRIAMVDTYKTVWSGNVSKGNAITLSESLEDAEALIIHIGSGNDYTVHFYDRTPDKLSNVITSGIGIISIAGGIIRLGVSNGISSNSITFDSSSTTNSPLRKIIKVKRGSFSV